MNIQDYLINVLWVYLIVGFLYTLVFYLPKQFKLIKTLSQPNWLRRDYFLAYFLVTMFAILTFPILWLFNYYATLKGAKKNV